jgi:hypothetical protein
MLVALYSAVGVIGLRSAELAFGPYRAYPTGSWPEAVAVVDLNCDGRKDVVMTTSTHFHSNDHSILIFFQSGLGQLQMPVRYDAGTDATSVVVADFTGDGKNDIAVGKQVSGIRLFVQQGFGDFHAFTDYQSSNATYICTADFNNDGRSDIACIGWTGSQVDVLTQTVAGAMSFSGRYHASYSGYTDLEAGDVNNDGLADIVVMDGLTFGHTNFSVLLQTNGGFAPAIPYDAVDILVTSALGIGDVTGDGRNDVVVSLAGNRPTSAIYVFPQFSSGRLAQQGTRYSSYDIPEALAVADVSLNGRPAIITLHGGWDAAGVCFQSAPGVIQPQQLYAIPYGFYHPHGLAVGDVNGDEMPDLVIADELNGLVVLTNRIEPPPFRITSISVNRDGKAVLSTRYRGGRGSCQVQACESLPHWYPIGVMSNDTWVDVSAPTGSKRLYRLLAQ